MGNYHTATVVASATAAYRLLFYHITNPHLVDNQLFRTMPRSGCSPRPVGHPHPQFPRGDLCGHFAENGERRDALRATEWGEVATALPW